MPSLFTPSFLVKSFSSVFMTPVSGVLFIFRLFRYDFVIFQTPNFVLGDIVQGRLAPEGEKTPGGAPFPG
jgi:hypothetical protein